MQARAMQGHVHSSRPGEFWNGILLNECRARRLGRDLDAAIRDIVKSARYELGTAPMRFRLQGPDHFYHAFDPDLEDWLRRPGRAGGPANTATFRGRWEGLHICLEDGWSGPLIAEVLAEHEPDEPFVLVHVDDHQDMMPTLLERGDGELIDPSTGHRFDPMASEDWSSPLASGALGIGNFLTALVHTGRCIHVRHLNNHLNQLTSQRIGPGFVSYPLIPNRHFAAVGWATPPHQSTGNYYAHTQADKLLAELPPGRLIAHIDLDYLINDFNGNPGRAPLSRNTAHTPEVSTKLDAFFGAIARAERPVERWIVAASPGFCAARHWDELFERLAIGVSQLA